MDLSTSIKINCPGCDHHVMAEINNGIGRFILFVCPNCHKNVIYFDNKVDTISDKALKKLIRRGKLHYCGVIDSEGVKKVESKEITPETVTDLKILLETSKSVDDFISKI